MAELGWTYYAIGRGASVQPVAWSAGVAGAHLRRLAGKPVKPRKPQLEVQEYYLEIGVGLGSLRWLKMLKVFRGCLIQFRGPCCLIARAGQPLLLAPCCS